MLKLILPHLVDHVLMAFFVPMHTPWTPFSQYKICLSRKYLKKVMFIGICRSPSYRPCVHGACSTMTHVHREMCPKIKKIWSFPHLVTNNLTFGISYAWKCSELTLHCLLKGYILSLLDALEEENLWEKQNYIGFVPHSFMLRYASLCPFEQPLMLYPRFPLSCELAIDMEDWSGGGSSGGLSLSISIRCWQLLSLVSLFIINRNINFPSIVCV